MLFNYYSDFLALVLTCCLVLQSFVLNWVSTAQLLTSNFYRHCRERPWPLQVRQYEISCNNITTVSFNWLMICIYTPVVDVLHFWNISEIIFLNWSFWFLRGDTQRESGDSVEGHQSLSVSRGEPSQRPLVAQTDLRQSDMSNDKMHRSEGTEQRLFILTELQISHRLLATFTSASIQEPTVFIYLF